MRGLEIGVHPHYRREMVILDAVAGLRVVWDDFPAAAGGLIVPSDNPVFSHILSLLRLLSSANICKINSCLSVKFIGSLIGPFIGPFIGSG